MTKFRADHASWIQTGKKAAESGHTKEALYALLVLMSTLFSAVETVIENQFELYAAIGKSNMTTGVPTNGKRP